MDESHRPVMLRKVVLGFPCTQNQTEFKFDLSLNYKMANIIQTYSDQKPALVVRFIFVFFFFDELLKLRSHYILECFT